MNGLPWKHKDPSVIFDIAPKYWASFIAHSVKNPPAIQETGVQFLGWEDPLEKEMAIQSSVLPGESHGQRRLEGSMGSLRVQKD